MGDLVFFRIRGSGVFGLCSRPAGSQDQIYLPIFDRGYCTPGSQEIQFFPVWDPSLDISPAPQVMRFHLFLYGTKSF